MPRLPIVPVATGTLRDAGAYIADLLTPTLRLGVTGLARSGKTVFITALVHSLVAGGRLPFFAPYAQGRIRRAYLEPQPDDAVPRFPYEEHLAALGRSPPEWPEGTRAISQLRVTIEFEPEGMVRRLLGSARLHLDIVDYPGEWLSDLALLDCDYGTWSARALELARAPHRRAAAQPFLEFLEGLALEAPLAEAVALEGAALYTRYLETARAREAGFAALGPGRFLMPGDLAGSPLLTFFPAPLSPGSEPARGTQGALLARRFESYKTHVVRPFFRDHFSRLDRQIVLVDVLAALNSGPPAIADLERGLQGVLEAFRPGANTWLSMLLGRRIDHVLFAATKADHLHHTSHDRLEAILRLLTERAIARASDAGADVRVMALAALRATREAEAQVGKDRLPCIVGTPLPGETIDGRRFDGKTEAAVFPGDLPADPRAALDGAAVPAADAACFVCFRPPRVMPPGLDGQAAPVPHIRLDRALDFLIGDRLA